ncbi:MAG: hypothetical protein IPL72_15290 [Sulfuritalea sp.]|nr:hypothetical protein [Sulfuritalea sp.]
MVICRVASADFSASGTSDAQIDHGRDGDPGIAEFFDGPIRIGVGRQHHHPLGRLDRPAMDQALRRRSQHDAGQVVVAEHGRLLVSPARRRSRHGRASVMRSASTSGTQWSA